MAVGRERFAPLLARFVKLAFDGMKLETFDLRDSTYHFFSLIAHTFEKDFVPALPDLVACILTTYRSDDGIVIQTAKSAFDHADGPTDGPTDGPSDSDADELASTFQPDKMTARFMCMCVCVCISRRRTRFFSFFM
jgi:hypothetical protein